MAVARDTHADDDLRGRQRAAARDRQRLRRARKRRGDAMFDVLIPDADDIIDVMVAWRIIAGWDIDNRDAVGRGIARFLAAAVEAVTRDTVVLRAVLNRLHAHRESPDADPPSRSDRRGD